MSHSGQKSADQPAMAFTVEFDSARTSKKTPPALFSARKMARRSAPVCASSAASAVAKASTDTKQYLLNKMLQGEGSDLPAPPARNAGNDRSPQKDADTISEAGTYVIEGTR